MKNWTVMTYLAGDNNLSEDMVTALRGMQAVGGNDYVNIAAFYDSGHPFTPSAYYSFTKDSREKRLSDCRVKEDISTRLDKAEAANDEAIIKFVEWCRTEYPAENYMLILSGHGDGFLGKVLLRDENPVGFVTMKQLKNLLTSVDGILNGKLAVLGFDSCVMNMLEVSYELRDAAKILISSEGLLPNSGWGYDRMLKNLVETNGAEPAEYYAKDFVKQFIRFHADYAVGGRSVDLSACDLTKIEPVVKGIGELAGLLREEFNALPKGFRENFNDDEKRADYTDFQLKTLVCEKLKKALLNAHWSSQTYLFDQAVDAGDFCANLRSECRQVREEMAVFDGKTLDKFAPERENGRVLFSKLEQIENACGKTLEALDEFVLKSSYTGSEYQFSQGVSFFFPWTMLGLMLVVERYKEMAFTTVTNKNWLSFLNRYLYETMREPRENGASAKTALAEEGKFNPESSKFNPESSKFNPESSKFNPESSKFNPESSKFNPESSKFNPESSKFNPESSKFNPFSSEGDLNGFLHVFSKTKNMPFAWTNPE